MSVEEKNVVDMIGTDVKTGKIKLTIFDHLDWEDADYHVFTLQDKLNTYLEFVDNGEIYDSYPAAKNQSLIIEVIGKYDLPVVGKKLINYVNTVSEGLGILVLFRYMPGQSMYN